MKYKPLIRIVVLIALVLPLGLLSCSNENADNAGTVAGHKHSYTCPMHPQVMSDDMGTCPICGMDLVPVEKNDQGNALKISTRGQILANISTMIVDDSSVSASGRLNGRLVSDPGRTSFISSRVAGRIVQLYVKETGIQVSRGMPLYKLYSEQLATLQQEYLMALAQEKQFPGDKIEKQLVASARQKLLLYGQSELQLRRLAESEKRDPYIVFYAPESGILAELQVSEGQYVEEGSPLIRLESYESLWVEADVYPSELKNIREGVKAEVVIPGWEDQPQQMSLNFVAPEIQAGSRLIRIRGSIPNPGGQWQPGLQAIVFLPSGAGSSVPVLPVDAVIRDSRGMHVWVKTAEDSFEPLLVTTGQETASEVEITAGLKSGDEVVVSGAYLLYSEYVLKRGKNPVEGLGMVDHAEH